MGKINKKTDESRTSSEVQLITVTCPKCPGWKAGPFKSEGAARIILDDHNRKNHP